MNLPPLEAIMDQAKVKVGAEKGGGELAMCGRAMRQRTIVTQSHQQRWGGGSSSNKAHRAKRG